VVVLEQVKGYISKGESVMCDRIIQPTYKRQRFLLSFLHQINNSVTTTDLQKLIFLNTMVGESDYYEFIPYKYGSYSFQLKEDVEILQKNGFIALEKTKNSTSVRAKGKSLHDTNYTIATERGNELIRSAYLKYPYYAINSEIACKILKDDELEHFHNIKQSYWRTDTILSTIGYEGKSIEEFINILIGDDVRLLCDVRKNPISRKFGFSKTKLKHITETVGIKYVHIPELGIDSDKRRSLRSPDDYTALLREYAKTIPERKESLDKVFVLLQQNRRIALMCYEHEPEMCHRHVIRDAIVGTYGLKSEDM
jgi:uncharacterized protein YwgA